MECEMRVVLRVRGVRRASRFTQINEQFVPKHERLLRAPATRSSCRPASSDRHVCTGWTQGTHGVHLEHGRCIACLQVTKHVSDSTTQRRHLLYLQVVPQLFIKLAAAC
jgi:hypothetical protein